MLKHNLSEQFAGKATRVATTFLALASFSLVLAQIKPFWVDEWRIIYNLKYKDSLALFGQLELVQQFPRVYLVAIKLFASTFDYSYFTLRFPSFVAGTAAIWLGYHLLTKLYRQGDSSRYLFILIVISSPAFTTYYIQVKQYTMDILISFFALWQLLEMRDLLFNRLQSPKKYLILVLSLGLAPFLSYTYPIVAAPMLILCIGVGVQRIKAGQKIYRIYNILPFIVATASLTVFILTDASRAATNPEMRLYWAYLMMQNGLEWPSLLRGFYALFAETGSGMLFQVLFGVIGILAFVVAVIKVPRLLADSFRDVSALIIIYSIGVVIIAVALYAAGKIPIGEPRLNAFVLPSMAILILNLLNHASCWTALLKPVRALTLLLYAGTIGHMFTSVLHQLTGSDYRKQLTIYEHTEDAIIAAQALGAPIFITSAIAYPDEHVVVYPNTTTSAETMCRPFVHAKSVHFNNENFLPGDWVLKTFPAYKTRYNLAVYAIDDIEKVNQYLEQLPNPVEVAIVGDGTTYKMISRRCR